MRLNFEGPKKAHSQNASFKGADIENPLFNGVLGIKTQIFISRAHIMPIKGTELILLPFPLKVP